MDGFAARPEGLWSVLSCVELFSASQGFVRQLCTGCPQRSSVIGGTQDAKVFLNFGIPTPVVSVLGALPDTGGEFLDVIEDVAPGCHFGEDFALRVHDGGVVTAEGLTDFRQ